MAQLMDVYDLGTATIAADGTVVTITGGFLEDSNCIENDKVRSKVDGYMSPILERLSGDTFRVPPWKGAALAGDGYEIYPESKLRINNGYLAARTQQLYDRIDSRGVIWQLPPGRVSPLGLSANDLQFIYSQSLNKVWQMQAGSWVELDPDTMLIMNKGPAGTIAVGTVTTGAPGSNAIVNNSGTAETATLNFTIPRGNTGAAATIAVGTVTTGAPGSNAAVSNSGTSGAAQFDFTIPTGKGYGGTSTTTMTVDVAGNKTFDTQAGLAYVAGDRVRIGAVASPTNWMEGFVLAYAGTSMTVGVYDYGGSGPFNSWGIGLTGKPGAGDGDMKAALALGEIATLGIQAEALDNLGIIDLSIVPVASGVQATEVADFANDKYWLDGRSYPSLLSWLRAGDSIFARDGYAWSQDNTGRYFKVGANTPRIVSDHTGTRRGILIEGTVTNRCAYSEDFSNAGWTKAGCSFVADTTITSPDGWRKATGGVALKMVEDTSNGQHTIYRQCVTVADLAHGVGFFVKAGPNRDKGFLYFVQSSIGCYVSFDLAAETVGTPVAMSTGVAIEAAIKKWLDGWYLIVLAGKIGPGATGGYIQLLMANPSGIGTYTGDGSSYMYVWGAMVVASVPLGSYIPNYTAATTTRSAEYLYRYLSSQPAAFTKVIKGRAPMMLPTDIALLLHIDDGTEANDFEVYRGTNGHLYLQLRVDWDEQATLDLGLVANDTDFSIAFRGSTAGIAASINGGAVISSSVAKWPSTLIVERYGVNATEDRFWNSTISYQATIPVAATNSELQALSA